VGRKNKVLGWALAAAAAGGVWFFADRPAPPASAPQPGAVAPKNEPRASPGTLVLPPRDGLSGPRGELFGSNAPPVRAAPRHKAPVEAAPPPAPVAPPMPYRVAGQVVHDGPPRVVLARDDRVFFVREGDVLEGGYRVESIKSDAVTLVYTPLDERQTLAVASALQVPVVPPTASAGRGAKQVQAGGGGRPAQLRWEGPASVTAGNDFEVALKITSDKLVRGSPLQLSYDAKVLEPVAVRAGEFYAEGSFTYRVNPNGSITVGAFGKGDVPDDAEFVVVTFKPIRAGATTELKLSSLVLQGAAGALVHEPLAAFRTSITQ
jgi:cohesin domain-containing protein